MATPDVSAAKHPIDFLQRELEGGGGGGGVRLHGFNKSINIWITNVFMLLDHAGKGLLCSHQPDWTVNMWIAMGLLSKVGKGLLNTNNATLHFTQ